MARVNPPPQIRRPKKITADRELRPYFERLEWLLFQLWTRTGSGNDVIDETGNAQIDTDNIYSLFGRFEELSSQIDDINPDGVAGLAGRLEDLSSDFDGTDHHAPFDPFTLRPDVAGTLVDLTTIGDQIVICSNTTPITITLNATPDDGEQVHIKRQNTGAVTVSGAIDGDTSLIIGFRYDSPHLVFTLEAGEWSII